ncbi:MAG: hypothetical protein ACT4QA_15460 [Panacagrimonas sp.]
MLRIHRYSIIALALSVLAGDALAQRGQPGVPDLLNKGPKPSTSRSPAPNYGLYEYGKETYAIKLGCTSCPLGDRPLDETMARKFLTDQAYWESLSDKEQAAVSFYLKERFSL